MAVDTRDKRLSIMHLSSPWRGLLPTPGTHDAADRLMVMFLYGGIAAGAAVEEPAPEVQPGTVMGGGGWVRLATYDRLPEAPPVSYAYDAVVLWPVWQVRARVAVGYINEVASVEGAAQLGLRVKAEVFHNHARMGTGVTQMPAWQVAARTSHRLDPQTLAEDEVDVLLLTL